MDAIYVDKVSKKYKNGVPALIDLSMTVPKGEIFSLLGPNGAGKSTLINILTTFLRPDSGNISILGKKLQTNPKVIRSRIACVAQRTSIDSFLSLKENMIFQSRLYKIPADEVGRRIENLITSFGLERYMKLPVSSYSGGVRRRLDIALAMLTRPDILFLDEPTTGMDIQSRKIMWNMIKQIQSEFGTTVFLTTHYLEEADNLSDRICIMKNGHEVIDGTQLELRNFLHQLKIAISFPPDLKKEDYFPQVQDGFPDYAWTYDQNQVSSCMKSSRINSNEFTQRLIDLKIPFSGVQFSAPTLEDVFLTLTTSSGNEVLK